jgi:hypothetical protein
VNDAALLSWINAGKNIAALLVAIGVAGEFIGDFVAGPVQARIDAARTAEIAHLTKDAAGAGKAAAEALERAAKAEENLGNAQKEAAAANERAAEANKIAEGEKLARIKLEARLAPRELNASQQTEIRERLKAIGRNDLDVFVYGDTPEIVRLAGAIVSSAHPVWNVRAWAVISGQTAVTGILVSTRPNADETTLKAADALVSALTNAGLSAQRWQAFNPDDLPGMLNGPTWERDKIAPIRMLIGSKP